MSLLGIIIDKSKARERLDSPKGFIVGSADEQLLKEIGAIVLEKGAWTPKYKGADVAEFLNWISEGKPKGPLPALAKRLLCLKREKLARGIKDAGTADYARTFEKKWIAEIDAIFSEAGERVECVVDFIKEKKAECPPVPVPPASVSPAPLPPASVQRVSVSIPSVPPSPVTPRSSHKSSLPTANNDNNNEDSGSDTDTAKVEKSPYDELLEKLVEKYGKVDSPTKPRLERILGALIIKRNAPNVNEIVDAINNIMAKDVTNDEQIKEINSIFGIIEQSVNADETLGAVERLVHEATAAKKTFYPEIKHLVQELIYTTCGAASLLDPLVDHLHNLIATFQTINSNNSRFTSIKTTLEDLREILMKEALDLEATEKGSVLKDKLTQLKKNLDTLNKNNASSTNIAPLRTQIQSLEALIESSDSIEALKEIKRSELNVEKDLLVQLIGLLGNKYDDMLSRVQGFLTNIDAELKVLSNASPNIKSITTECNRRAFEYRKFLEILKTSESETHKGEMAALEAQHADEIRRQAEDKDAIISRLQTQLDTDIPYKDARINALTEELAAANAKIERLDSSNAEKELRAREASAAKNALNEELLRARAQIAALQEELRKVEQTSRNIKERNDIIAAFERNYETVVSSGIEKNRLLNEERASHSAERNKLTGQLAEEQAGHTANVASRNARIAELEGQLATGKNAATERAASRDVLRLTNELAAARRNGENIDRLTAELRTARARHDSNASNISELQTQVARIGDLERDLNAARASVADRNGNVAERNRRITDLEATLAAEKTGRAGNAADRNARIATLQKEYNAAIASAGTERQAYQDTVDSLTKIVEDKDRRIDELEAATAAVSRLTELQTKARHARERATTGAAAVATRFGMSEKQKIRNMISEYKKLHNKLWTSMTEEEQTALIGKPLASLESPAREQWREAVAEVAAIERARSSSAAAGVASHGGTRKQKKKTARHTRKLKK